MTSIQITPVDTQSFQMKTRGNKFQKIDENEQLQSQSKSASGKKGRSAKAQKVGDTDSEDLDPKPTLLEMLHKELIVKKRDYKAALKAWKAEKAKHAYIFEPVTEDEEDQ